MEVIFLGHGNSALAILIENLISQVKQQQLIIKIISNLDDIQAWSYFNLTQQPDIKVEEYNHSEFNQFTEKPPNLILAALQPKSKRQILHFFQQKWPDQIKLTNFINLIPPTATIAKTVQLGHGLQINPGVVVAPFTRLGNFVSLNRNVSLGHHVVVEDYVTINPGTNIAGFCQIGENTVIGMGANIVENVKIGKNVVVGAGSLVTKDVPDNVVVYGVPAKIIRQNNSK